MPSKIEWTGETWNPIAGCSIVSPGCTNCYAMRMAARIERMSPGLEHYRDLTKPSKAGPVWTGNVALAPERTLLEPLRRKKPTTWFVNSMSDLFHEDVPDGWIDRVFAVMALCPQHTFQVLTKRAGRMREYMTTPSRKRAIAGEPCLDIADLMARLAGSCAARPTLDHFSACFAGNGPFPNVWLGVSCERQQEADARIPDLLATPAAVRFVSAEPLLGPVDFTRIRGTTCLATSGSCCGGRTQVDALRGIQFCERAGAYAFPGKTGMPKGLDWIIVGGESGPGARPMHPDWARAIRDQCAAAGTAFFFKQWGEWAWSDDGVTYTDAATTWGNQRFPRGTHLEHHSCGRTAFRVGKKASGRLLDGRTHDAYPERALETV